MQAKLLTTCGVRSNTFRSRKELKGRWVCIKSNSLTRNVGIVPDIRFLYNEGEDGFSQF
jgi:hypothetical protein